MLRSLKKFYHKLRFALTVNWYKTLLFNFKMFPWATARKLPVFFYGKVKFSSLQGKLTIKAPIKRAMIGFGQKFEFPSTSQGTSELVLSGHLIFNGNAQIGRDFAVSIGKNAVCEFGYMGCLGSRVKLICKKEIRIGAWTGIGYESQLTDTNHHPMKNSETGTYYPMVLPVRLGSHNAVSNRVTFMPGCQTPDFCVIASNSLCNKNYKELGKHVLLGGIPAKMIKKNYTRDWENEKELLKKYKIIDF